MSQEKRSQQNSQYANEKHKSFFLQKLFQIHQADNIFKTNSDLNKILSIRLHIPSQY